MEWWVILVILLAIPVILSPVAFIWYLNVSGLYTVIRESQKRRVARKRRIRELQMAEEAVTQEVR